MRLVAAFAWVAFASALLVLVASGLAGVRSEEADYRHGIEVDHAELGAVLRTALDEQAARTGGGPESLELPVERRGGAPVDGPLKVRCGEHAPERLTRSTERGVEGVETEVPLGAPSLAGCSVVLFDSLTERGAFARHTWERKVASALALAALMGVATLLFGRLWVARPIERLIAQLDALARGELALNGLRRGDELGALAQQLDATARLLDEARRRAEAEAEARVQAIEQLRHADRLSTVGRLAAGLAHELGTPLHVIRARASALKTERDEQKRARYAEVVSTQVDRVIRLVRRLLDFARRDRSSASLTRLDALATQVAELLAPLARERRVDVVCEASAPLEVWADGDELEQVLTNLLGNALDASPEGATVTVHVEAAGDAARISVRDLGPGVPDDVREVMFDPFFTTKAPGKGTGLGLAIVRAIAEKHGGRAYCAARPPPGAELVVELPLPLPPSRALAQPQGGPSPAPSPTSP